MYLKMKKTQQHLLQPYRNTSAQEHTFMNWQQTRHIMEMIKGLARLTYEASLGGLRMNNLDKITKNNKLDI